MLNGRLRSCLGISSSRSAPRSTSRRTRRPPMPPGRPASGFRLRRQRHHVRDDGRSIGCAARPAQSDSAFIDRRRLSGGRSERYGEAIRRPRQSAPDLGQHHRRAAGAARRSALHYDNDATATAASLSVDPGVTPDQLAAITPAGSSRPARGLQRGSARPVRARQSGAGRR